MIVIIIIALFSLFAPGYEQLPISMDVLRLTEKLHSIDKSVGESIMINEDLTANNNAFISVNESALDSPTFRAFIQLRKHFTSEKCTQEDDTALKADAIENFMNAIFATEVMKTTEDFIVSNGFLNNKFRSYVEHLWFEEYASCQEVNGSSGFEHVFLGETDITNVEGYHSWVSLYIDAKCRELKITDVLDFMEISNKVQIAAISFDWKNSSKPLSSLLIGSTPELEMSLYTLASLLNGNGTISVSMNDIVFDIQSILKPMGSLLYTAYPIIP